MISQNIVPKLGLLYFKKGWQACSMKYRTKKEPPQNKKTKRKASTWKKNKNKKQKTKETKHHQLRNIKESILNEV